MTGPAWTMPCPDEIVLDDDGQPSVLQYRGMRTVDMKHLSDCIRGAGRLFGGQFLVLTAADEVEVRFVDTIACMLGWGNAKWDCDIAVEKV